jgi:phosphoglycerate kinase
MSRKMSLRQLDPRGKRVLMRVDFNVPLDKGRRITDDTRIVESLPSIRYVLDGGGSVILMSHLGRPKGGPDPAYSLRPVADRLGELLAAPVRFAADVVGPDAVAQAGRLAPGEVLLLENVRFEPGEERNDAGLSAALAQLGDAYVNDAFGSAHRAHASTAGIAAHFARRYAGFLMEKELEHLGTLLGDPPRPFVAVLGGAKVKGKVEVIESLLQRVDALLLGGGMIFTFFQVRGLAVGNSLVDRDSLDVVRRIVEQAKTSRAQLILPEDVVVADDFTAQANRREVLVTDIPDGWQGLDIGPQTIARYRQIIGGAKSVFWNGPVGVFELAPFAVGTRAVGEAIALATDAGALTVVGGGDSVAALNQMGLGDRVSHVSTGGGASLEFMGGLDLPGVAALSDA